MSDSQETISCPYVQAIESFESFEKSLQQDNLNLPNILENLNNCSKQIDVIIESETPNNNHLIPIFHINSQLKNLAENVTKKLNQPPIQIEKRYLYHSVLRTNIKRPKINDVQEQNNKLTDLIKRTIVIPKVNGLHEIAGLWEVKKALKSLVVLPKLQPQLFENRKISNSVLLFGPPGTGKTRLVHALAAEANTTLHSVSSSDLLSPFIGESEKTVQALFNFIREKDNFKLLFIDEIDGLCCKRNTSEQEHSRRLKTEFLCQMSKIEDCSNLFIICATNCPWDLDTAFLRRFQKRIYIPLPNRAERCELLKLFTRNTPLEMVAANSFLEVLNKTEGYSGSDLSDLVQYALNIPLIELDDTRIWLTTSDGFYEPASKIVQNVSEVICCDLNELPPNSVRARSVNVDDLNVALDNVQMTVRESDIKKFLAFNNKR